MLGPSPARVPTLYDARGRLLQCPRGRTPTGDLSGTHTPDASRRRTPGRARSGAHGGGSRPLARSGRCRERLQGSQGSARSPRGSRRRGDRRAAPPGGVRPLYATGRFQDLAGRSAVGAHPIREYGATLGRVGCVAGQDRGDHRGGGSFGESPGGRGGRTHRRARGRGPREGEGRKAAGSARGGEGWEAGGATWFLKKTVRALGSRKHRVPTEPGGVNFLQRRA